MRSYDFAPLLRSTIGFDRLFDLAEAVIGSARKTTHPLTSNGWPRTGTRFRWHVAGFSPDEISVTAEQNVVTTEGNKAEKTIASCPALRAASICCCRN